VTRRFPDRPVLSVGAVILRRNRVVLVKRGQPPLLGEWSLPGGVVEVGETLTEAVAREVLEETGLVVQAGPVVEVVERLDHADDGRVEYHFVIVDYLCRAESDGIVAGSDAADVRWVPVADLPAYRLTGTAMAVIERALRQTMPGVKTSP
jgi:8-oxo-dGTP diphosphatase